MKRVLLTGENGQLGYELRKMLPKGIDLLALDKRQLDISNAALVNDVIKRESPDWVINAAAYTQVDKAEDQSELAFSVNAKGPENLATSCNQFGTKLLQISTDFIFDGKLVSPYGIEKKPNPLNIYGLSKLKGDEAVTAVLADNSVILRTSWVYSEHGNNFVKTMLRLMKQRDELNIVDDQISTPTWAQNLAKIIWVIIAKDLRGTFHWSDAGVASWYDFAVAIQKEAVELGLLDKKIQINPIPSSHYPALAKRPSFSVLDKHLSYEKITTETEHWQDALHKMLQQLADKL